jgi:pimeloyl-ACP methyl ester carboxylesterase
MPDLRASRFKVLRLTSLAGFYATRLKSFHQRRDMEITSTQSNQGQTAPVNDIEMYYEILGEGEPLILLHGGGGVGANWNLVFKTPPRGSRLIIPDQRGHGRSTNSSKEFTFRQSALDIFALLDHLGIERFRAIGMSLGAKTLLHMAIGQPHRVEAMVLVSAAPYFPEQARAIMRETTPDNRSEHEWRPNEAMA